MLWGGPAAETAGATVKQAHALFELALEHLRLPCAQTLHSCWGNMFQAALQAGRLFRGSLRSRFAFLRSQGIAEARGRSDAF